MSERTTMSSTFAVQEEDSRLAGEINREARSDPSSPYAGKFVAIAGGKVVAVGERLDEVASALKQATEEPRQGLIIEASADYQGPHEIWST
jgi:Family of unknown function (DUF5678)